jgi:6-phosphogluconate dehydrogenase
VWSNQEAVELHVPANTLEVAHAFRIASAYRGERERANKTTSGGFPLQEMGLQGNEKDTFLEDLRQATYAACLASYIQGLNVIQRADQQYEYELDYANIWQIWRGGCIIRWDYMAEQILKPILTTNPKPNDVNLLFNPRTMEDVKKTYASLKKVVVKAVETDQVAPALSTTLEYFKIVTGTDLPTEFYEAELDYFGSHMFDKKGDKDVGGPTEGKHHFEWRPARSQKGEYGKVSKL